MKLSKWAEKQGISYQTAYKWFHDGRIPNAEQLDTGTILVHESKSDDLSTIERVVIYCRVSNWSRKKELEYQVNRCKEYCELHNLPVFKIYKEVASGMNDRRKELMKMLLDCKPSMIVIENKDRLTRFGFNYIDCLLDRLNCKIVTINEMAEDEKDLMTDMVSILTSFCCRLYGLRRGHNKVNKMKSIMEDETDKIETK